MRDQIINREFDLIIYGRMSPYDPGTINLDDPLNMPIFYRDILATYPKNRVVAIFGSDETMDNRKIVDALVEYTSLNGYGVAGYTFFREMI